MEAEIIPMCEDQGMAIIPWAALGGGQLITAEQRKQKEQDPGARKGYGLSENDIKVCEVLEQIARSKNTTLQAIVCPVIRPKLYCQSLTGNANRLWRTCFSNQLTSSPLLASRPSSMSKRCLMRYASKSKEEIDEIQTAVLFNPLFPMNFLFNFRGDQKYNLNLTAADNQQYQMAASDSCVDRCTLETSSK